MEGASVGGRCFYGWEVLLWVGRASVNHECKTCGCDPEACHKSISKIYMKPRNYRETIKKIKLVMGKINLR